MTPSKPPPPDPHEVEPDDRTLPAGELFADALRISGMEQTAPILPPGADGSEEPTGEVTSPVPRGEFPPPPRPPSGRRLLSGLALGAAAAGLVAASVLAVLGEGATPGPPPPTPIPRPVPPGRGMGSSEATVPPPDEAAAPGKLPDDLAARRAAITTVPSLARPPPREEGAVPLTLLRREHPRPKKPRVARLKLEAKTKGADNRQEAVSARVEINGRRLGQSPLEVDLRPGTHRIRLEHPGHRPVEFTVQVRGGTLVEVVADIRARQAVAPGKAHRHR
jgi:hypothetical protein